jgi:hypothetical protein
VALVALLVLGAAGAAASGCGKSDSATTRASHRGEACQVTNDCLEGLACAPLPNGGGFCVTGEFHVRVTAKDCAVVECASAADCCDDSLAAGCAQLRSLCYADAGVSSSQACSQYFSQCGCETGRVDCEVGRCVSKCTLDSDCTSAGAGRRCSGGKCVACATDGDCPGGQQCATGVCHPGCSTDGDCTGFDRCVAAKCLASGCQADRECVALTRNVDARCGTDGKCIVPCETDLECSSPTSYNFYSCIDKECTYVGCESDKDCRLFYGGLTDAALGPKQHAVCRDRGLVGDVVRPAP